MPKYAAKADDNQAEIVAALRKAGAMVEHLHAVGRGCPDILVAYKGWHIIEIKDGGKSPSQRKLTPKEAEWHAKFSPHAPVHICTCAEDALRVIGAIAA